MVAVTLGEFMFAIECRVFQDFKHLGIVLWVAVHPDRLVTLLIFGGEIFARGHRGLVHPERYCLNLGAKIWSEFLPVRREMEVKAVAWNKRIDAAELVGHVAAFGDMSEEPDHE